MPKYRTQIPALDGPIAGIPPPVNAERVSFYKIMGYRDPQIALRHFKSTFFPCFGDLEEPEEGGFWQLTVYDFQKNMSVHKLKGADLENGWRLRIYGSIFCNR